MSKLFLARLRSSSSPLSSSLPSATRSIASHVRAPAPTATRTAPAPRLAAAGMAMTMPRTRVRTFSDSPPKKLYATHYFWGDSSVMSIHVNPPTIVEDPQLNYRKLKRAGSFAVAFAERADELESFNWSGGHDKMTFKLTLDQAGEIMAESFPLILKSKYFTYESKFEESGNGPSSSTDHGWKSLEITEDNGMYRVTYKEDRTDGGNNRKCVSLLKKGQLKVLQALMGGVMPGMVAWNMSCSPWVSSQ